MFIKQARLGLAVLLVVLASAGAAYGETLTFSPAAGENIEFLSEALTLEGGGGAVRVTCAVTLSGSMSQNSFTIVEGTSFGSINNSASASGCSGGSLSFLSIRERPLPLTYRSFLGTLPNLTGIRYRVGEVRLQATGALTCLYTGNVDALMELTEIDAWTVEPGSIAEARLTLSSGALCPETATLSGRLALQNMQVALRPIMRWNPPGINFGRVRVRTSEGRTSRFENISAGEIEITEVRSRGSGCASFRFTNGGGRLAPRQRLASRGTIEITATFEPTSIGPKICDYEVRARLGAEGGRQASLVVSGVGI